MENTKVTIRRCTFEDNRERMTEYYKENNVVLDSFLEDYIKEARHYQFVLDSKSIGYFAIHEEKVLVCFFVEASYGVYYQELFLRAKRMEFCNQAMIPTGDELFLSLAMDSYTRIEKQAYFSLYTNEHSPSSLPEIILKEADVVADRSLLESAGDFLEHKLEKIESGNQLLQIYLVKYQEELVGFGNVEVSLITDFASTGMMVLPAYRQKRLGTAILYQLAQLVKAQGKTPISGCWYYNHKSKQTMQAAGAYSPTRLLHFYF